MFSHSSIHKANLSSLLSGDVALMHDCRGLLACWRGKGETLQLSDRKMRPARATRSSLSEKWHEKEELARSEEGAIGEDGLDEHHGLS